MAMAVMLMLKILSCDPLMYSMKACIKICCPGFMAILMAIFDRFAFMEFFWATVSVGLVKLEPRAWRERSCFCKFLKPRGSADLRATWYPS